MSETLRVVSEHPLPRRLLLSARIWILAVVYVSVFVSSYVLAYELRFDFLIPAQVRHVLWTTLPWIAILKLSVFYLTGNYFGWWRYITFSDLTALLRTASLALFEASDTGVPLKRIKKNARQVT